MDKKTVVFACFDKNKGIIILNKKVDRLYFESQMKLMKEGDVFSYALVNIENSTSDELNMTSNREDKRYIAAIKVDNDIYYRVTMNNTVRNSIVLEALNYVYII